MPPRRIAPLFRLGAFWPLVLLACALGAAATAQPMGDEARAATAGCRRGAVAPPSGIVGISDPNTLDPGVIELIRETGVDWVRAEFHWSRIQPAAGGPYDWAPYDRMVRAFNKAGIHVQAILTYIPEKRFRSYAEIDAAWQDFAAAAVARYAPMGVHHWEIFNEPNLPGYGWLTKRDDARTHLGFYSLLLARANEAVRENDPRGVVILGGLASDQHRGLPAEETMDILYSYGIKDCFDVFAYHPYGYQNRLPEARARVDRILKAHGDTGKPVWFNEYGWTEQRAMDMAKNDTAATNPMMAIFSQRHSADALFWFAAKDYSSRLGTPAFGLADFNLRKRPSFETFRRLVDETKAD